MEKFTRHPDSLGLAYQSFYEGNADAFFTLYSKMFDPDDIPVSYFFRTFSEMPPLEQRALKECKGSILDVGAGSGTHSLILQKTNQVTALDISPLSVEVMKNRGVHNVVCQDFFSYSEKKFDTILLLMNGIGLIESINNFPRFFNHISTLLNPHGQILIDSSDLRYLFEQEDGSFLIPLEETYYGEVDFQVAFEHYISDSFSWVYVDFETLAEAATTAGFTCELVAEGEHYDFLARIQK